MVGPLLRSFVPAAGIVLALLLAPAGRVAGHPLSVSYSRFDVAPAGIAARVRLPLDDVDLLLQLDRNLDDTVSLEEIESAREAISAYLAPRLVLRAGGRPVALAVSHLGLWHDTDAFAFLEVLLRGDVVRPRDPLDIEVRVLSDLYSDHRNLSEVVMGADRRQFVFQNRNTWRVELGRTSPWRTVREFTLLGVQHIVTGYDHVLFLVGLLVVGRGLRPVVAIVTSFTVAHSISLALAALGIVDPVGWMVEAAIALSIVYVGVENLVAREVRHRWVLTFAFGLVHGLGFAGILREMELERRGLAASLVSFNLGVELGQVAIVALLWPALRMLDRTRHRERVVRFVSAVIVAFGAFWFVERIA